MRTPPPPAEPAGAPVDERLAFRGPIQRLLLRPEIGALIGTTAVWVFFWAVAPVFGTAAGTANYLDVAAILGIMAVAVSLLMIGGEFDLSSGSITGATAMLVILLSKEVGELGGAGLTLFIAVPLSFAFAMMIGWFNGTMVDKTRLPSFIVTLGTFFILIGAKAGFSRLLAGQVVVEGLNESDGYDFWSKIFAASWIRNDHLWEDRDVAWTILLIVGAALVAIGVLELSYRRAEQRNAKGLIVARGRRRGRLRRVLRPAQQRWRAEEHRQRRPPRRWDPCSRARLGDVAVPAARSPRRRHVRQRQRAAHRARPGGGRRQRGPRRPDQRRLDERCRRARLRRLRRGPCWPSGSGSPASSPSSSPPARSRSGRRSPASSSRRVPAVGFLMTRQGARAVMFVGLAVAGIIMLLVAGVKAADVSASAGLVVELITAAVVAGLAFFIRSESTSPKFRTELFTVLLLIALALVCSALLGYLFEARTTTDAAADTLGQRLAIGGVVLIVVATAIQMLYTTAAENAVASGVIRYRISILWFILFAAFGTWLLVRTRFGNWIFAVGGNKEAARAEGVPASRTKTTLFMIVSGAGVAVGHAHRLPPQLRPGERRRRRGVRVHHRRRRRRQPADRRLRLGGRRGDRLADHVDVHPGHPVRRLEHQLALPVPRRDPAARRDRQQLRPQQGGAIEMTDTDTNIVTDTPLLEVRNLCKYYGNVIALNGITTTVRAGQVTCVLGDNGAGKSTFIKIFSGVHQQSEGELLLDGERVKFASPRDALDAGIATVFQDLAVVPLMSVWRNFWLGDEPRKGFRPFRRIDIPKAKRIAKEELGKMGIDIRDTEQPVGTLSGGERQSVAIARAAYRGARVLILDEPTSALGVKQSGVVLKYVVQAAQRNLGVIFITHNPHHAYPVGDRFLILNRGHSLGNFAKEEISQEELTGLMAGGSELKELQHELSAQLSRDRSTQVDG